MPHDKNGKPLKEGDEVIIRGKVNYLSTGTEYCNVTVETLEKFYPGDAPTIFTALNTRQVELVESAVVEPAAEAEAAPVVAQSEQEAQ